MSVPVLRYACLAYAAKVLFLRGKVSASANEYYQSQVISEVLESLSSQPFPEHDEGLLAAAVILRMAEQFCEVNQDVHQHLSGALSLFSLRGSQTKWSMKHNDLSGTAFWICIRESLRHCFLNEERCHFDLDLIEEDLICPDDAEEVWTNRTTLMLARACNHVFGSTEGDTNDPKVTELKEQIDRWVQSVPASYRAWNCSKYNSTTGLRPLYFSVWHGRSSKYQKHNLVSDAP